MTPTRLALTALVAACLTTAAWAEEQEWVLRVKQEAKSLAITLNGHSSYGSGANRVQGSGNVVERARARQARRDQLFLMCLLGVI